MSQVFMAPGSVLLWVQNKVCLYVQVTIIITYHINSSSRNCCNYP